MQSTIQGNHIDLKGSLISHACKNSIVTVMWPMHVAKVLVNRKRLSTRLMDGL